MDIILGMIGGFVGLIHLLLTWAIGDYQRFKFTTALISEAYSTTSKSRMSEGNEPQNLDDAYSDMKQCLETY